MLGAGERWSVPLETSAAAPQPPPVELPRSVDPSLDGSPSSTASAAPGVSAPAPAVRSSADISAAPPRRERAAQTPAESGARTLFDRGNAARRQGDLAGAAHAYEQLLREYPADARAGLAGFELGRLRMDQFDDAPGAIPPLQLAVRVVSEAGLREDALARLVHAFELTKELERCRAARAEYLEAYPKGTHVLAVVRSCGEK
jgi:tetratricopeptide (TPR) repeat protein